MGCKPHKESATTQGNHLIHFTLIGNEVVKPVNFVWSLIQSH